MAIYPYETTGTFVVPNHVDVPVGDRKTLAPLGRTHKGSLPQRSAARMNGAATTKDGTVLNIAAEDFTSAATGSRTRSPGEACRSIGSPERFKGKRHRFNRSSERFKGKRHLIDRIPGTVQRQTTSDRSDPRNGSKANGI
jgi:hypothetical protein